MEHVAPNALHDSGHVFDPPKCHPGTRVAVIQAIMDWLAGVHEDTHDKGVTWLTGGAGAGKSAIGRTVCERCAEEGTLLASFFFSSSDATRNHSKTLVQTIAYQICPIDPSMRKAVSDLIDNDPHIFSKSLRAQLVSLVVEPLLSLYDSGPQTLRRLIIIDGLDECVDKSSQRDILETIADLITTYPQLPIRFLVCSRPESNIENVVHGFRMSAVVSTISLSNDYAAREDIERYLRDNFNTIRQGHTFKRSIPSSWPSETDISILIDKSSGQFLYASTVIRYIESLDDMPHQRLEVILGLRPPHGELPFAQLDALYTHILTTTKDPPKAAKILAFIARYPGTYIPFIAKYSELEDEEVEIILSRLAAIIRRRRYLCSDVYDQFFLLHKSCNDFLSDPSRSKELYVSFPDAVASDILRSIQIFSGKPFLLEFRLFLYIGAYVRPVSIEPSDHCRFHYDWFAHFGHSPFAYYANTYADILECEGCFPNSSNSPRADVIIAVLKFPIESFSNELFSRHKYFCAEFQFTHCLFKIVFQLVSLASR